MTILNCLAQDHARLNQAALYRNGNTGLELLAASVAAGAEHFASQNCWPCRRHSRLKAFHPSAAIHSLARIVDIFAPAHRVFRPLDLARFGSTRFRRRAVQQKFGLTFAAGSALWENWNLTRFRLRV